MKEPLANRGNEPGRGNLQTALDRQPHEKLRRAGDKSIIGKPSTRIPTRRAPARIQRSRWSITPFARRGAGSVSSSAVPAASASARIKSVGMAARLQEIQRPKRARQVTPEQPRGTKSHERPSGGRDSPDQQEHSGNAQRRARSPASAPRSVRICSKRAHDPLGMRKGETARSLGRSKPDSWPPPKRIDRQDDDGDQPDAGMAANPDRKSARSGLAASGPCSRWARRPAPLVLRTQPA